MNKPKLILFDVDGVLTDGKASINILGMSYFSTPFSLLKYFTENK